MDRPTSDYRLPDGRIVAVFEDVARNAPFVSFTLIGGKIVVASKVY